MGIQWSSTGASSYIKKEECPISGVIQSVEMQEIDGDNGKEKKVVAYIKGVEKGWIVNRTNGNIIADAYGDDTDAWVGKTIELFNNPSVTYAGKRVGGISVRIPTTAPQSNPIQAPAPAAVEIWTWEHAQAKAFAAGLPLDALKTALKGRGLTSYNAARDTAFVKQLIAEFANVQPSAKRRFLRRKKFRSNVPHFHHQQCATEVPRTVFLGLLGRLMFNTEPIPDELKARNQWVCWRIERRAGRDTKVPVNAQDGTLAKSNDPATWASFGDAVNYANAGGIGIGFVFSADDPFVGIDLDDCITDGVLSLAACEIVHERLTSYCEISPSGTGLHIIGAGKLPPGGRNATMQGQRIEMYDSVRFFCMTGNRWAGSCRAINDVQSELDILHGELFPNATKPAVQVPANIARVFASGNENTIRRARKYIAACRSASEGGRNNAVFSIAGHLAAIVSADGESLSESDVIDLAMEFNQTRCTPPLAEAECRAAARSALYRGTPRSPKVSTVAKRREWETTAPTKTQPAAHEPIPDVPLDDDGPAAPAPQRFAGDPFTEEVPLDPPPRPKVTAPTNGSTRFYTYGEIVDEHPEEPEEIVGGVLRRGETLVLAGGSKFGKTTTIAGLAICIATGAKWLGKFQCRQGRVLVVDNELFKGTISRRYRTIATMMRADRETLTRNLVYLPLRGNLRDIRQIGSEVLGRFAPGELSLVVLDALYRTYPPGSNENDNAGMADIFNRIDVFAAHLQSGVLIAHHTPKGDMGLRNVLDIAAGAGAMIRATDSLVGFKEHEERDCFVVETRFRTQPPIEPFVVEKQFPVFVPRDDLDAAAIKTAKGARIAAAGATGRPAKFTREECYDCLPLEPLTREQIGDHFPADRRPSVRDLDQWLRYWVSEGLLHRHESPRNGARPVVRYGKIPQSIIDMSTKQ
jgi:hypothetical protein